MVIKTLDPDWIQIRIWIGIQPEMLDLDPYQMNTDSKHCTVKMHHLFVSGSSSSTASVCPASPRSAPPSPEPMMDLDPAHSAAPSTARQEKPIFTLKQMTMIAERMCKVRQINFVLLYRVVDLD